MRKPPAATRGRARLRRCARPAVLTVALLRLRNRVFARLAFASRPRVSRRCLPQPHSPFWRARGSVGNLRRRHLRLLPHHRPGSHRAPRFAPEAASIPRDRVRLPPASILIDQIAFSYLSHALAIAMVAGRLGSTVIPEPSPTKRLEIFRFRPQDPQIATRPALRGSPLYLDGDAEGRARP